ncbi:MAG: hypothetical protein LQ343_004094 [Gyalolechia ehrenbergii]|nr:MAG: hypothetical protein LQ343_004094 [Gyalolechia ehrenbergii]
MLLLALTGSLATGKSTVSTLLSQPPYSLPIIDADLLARRVVEPGTRGYKQILKHFSATTPDLLLPPESPSTDTPTSNNASLPHQKNKKAERGRPLNRPALGRRIFGSTPSRIRARKTLNSIIHPLVRLEIAKSILYHFLLGHWAIVLDIPLLYDSGLDIFCPVVLMIAASPEIQLSRLRARDPHLSEKEARDRVASQSAVGGKVARTEARGVGRGFVVWNDGTREELAGEVGRVMREVERGRRGVWRWVFWVGWPVAVVWGMWEVWRGWSGRREWEKGERDREREGKKGK